MTDLQGLSSNIVLIGFVLVGIACLYLLYSNYKKTQELEELQIQIRVLKDVFTTSQKNYYELRENVLSSLHNNTSKPTNLTESRPINIQEINLSTVSKERDDIKTIKVHQQDLLSTILNSNIDDSVKETKDTKQIEIVDDDVNNDINDLKELDDLDNPQESDTTDELNEYSNDDENTIDLGNVDEIREHILDPIHSFKDNDESGLDIEDIIDDMIDEEILDTKSIQTDPNNNELNDLDIDIDLEELQNHVDDNTIQIDLDIETDDKIVV